MRSSGPPTRRTATAHTLKAGIRLVGSSAGSVRALALDPPPQWKGAKTTSGRTASVSCAWNRARPRRVDSSTTSSWAIPSVRARSGGSSARGGGAISCRLRERGGGGRGGGRPGPGGGGDRLRAARARGRGAGLVRGEPRAGGEQVGGLGVGLLVRGHVLDPPEPRPPVRGGEPVGEQAGRARVVD